MSADDIDVVVDIKFAVIPEWVIYSELSDRAFRLYAVLRKHANNETGESRPSRARLAELMRVSLSTIDRTLAELAKAKVIEIRHRWSNAGKTSYSSTRDSVHLTPAPNLYVVKSVPPSSSGSRTGGDTPSDGDTGSRTNAAKGGRTDEARGSRTGDARTRPPRTRPNRTKEDGGFVAEVTHLRSDEIETAPLRSCADHDRPRTDCSACQTARRKYNRDNIGHDVAPSPYCDRHPGGTADPCGPCKSARSSREVWDVEHATRVAKHNELEIRFAADLRATEIANCSMCDGDGYEGKRLCDHNPRQVETNLRGRALCDAALAKKQAS